MRTNYAAQGYIKNGRRNRTFAGWLGWHAIDIARFFQFAVLVLILIKVW